MNYVSESPFNVHPMCVYEYSSWLSLGKGTDRATPVSLLLRTLSPALLPHDGCPLPPA